MVSITVAVGSCSRIIQFKFVVADFQRIQKCEDSGYRVLDIQSGLFLTGVLYALHISRPTVSTTVDREHVFYQAWN